MTRLDRLDHSRPIVTTALAPTDQMQLAWQRVCEAIEAAVQQDQTSAWTAATGTASRATFATYTAPAISNPPTQAEVQAIADAVQAHSQRLKALIDDLTTIGALTS